MPDSIQAFLTPAVDRLGKVIEGLGPRLDRIAPAPREIDPQALVAAKKFRDVMRAMQRQAPIALSAAASSKSAIALKWTFDDPAMSQRKLLRSRSPDFDRFAEIATPGPTDSGHVDGSLDPKTTYRYKLIARSPEGDDWSAIAEATTLS